MKTQILQLDSHDDALSVRDKMGWGQTGRILLVWPETGRILTRRLDLVLLQRHCATLGAQLALVTRDNEVGYHAAELGVPIFDSPRHAQQSRWRGNRRRRPRPHRHSPRPDLQILREQAHSPFTSWEAHPATRLVVFSLCVVALMVLAALLLPSAQIRLSPRLQQQTLSIPVSSSDTFTAVNLAGELPAHWQTVVVEGRDSLTTTGSLSIGYGFAIGGIQFTNLTEHAITIPAGAVISTLGADPQRFALTRAGQLPAGAGRTLSLNARALLPGESGNLPAHSLIAVEGDLGLSVAAINLAPTNGGSNADAPAPSSADRAVLYEQLLASLQSTAQADLRAGLQDGDLLLTPTLALVSVLEETYSPQEGLPGSQLDLTLRVEFHALVVSHLDLQALAEPVLDASLPEGYLPQPETLVITHLTQPVLGDDGKLRWTIQAQRSLIASLSAPQAADLVHGLPVERAGDRLQQALPLADAPQIELFPSWWPRLPYLAFRIQIIASQDSGETASVR